MRESSEQLMLALVDRVRQRALELLKSGDPGALSAEPLVDLERLGDHQDLRLAQLIKLFALDPLAVDLVICLAAVEYEPALREYVRAHQRDAERPCIELGMVSDLLGLGASGVPRLMRVLDPEGPLRRFALVKILETTSFEPAVFRRLRLSSRVARYLVGDDTLAEGFSLESTAGASRALSERHAPLYRRILSALRHEPIAVEILGKPDTGRSTLASLIAHRLGKALLTLELRAVDAPQLDLRLAKLRREARLCEALPVLLNWDAVIPTARPAEPQAGEGAASTPSARAMPPPMAEFLRSMDSTVCFVAEEQEPLLGAYAPSVVTVELPFPTPQERAALFKEALDKRGFAVAEDVDLESLARRHALAARHIDIAARTAVDEARDAESSSVSLKQLTSACRQQVRHDLKSIAERVVNSHDWGDLVIPGDVLDALREMVAYVQHSERVYDDWGFAGRHSLSRGVSALFSGPPGTGKTMCASVMARVLDMELFRVDLSRVVSKWIGETEKNLARIFHEAEHSNAIILFDEADSLFAKRTEVRSSNDRYANLEVNFLLQKMEGFSGVTILTTNFEDTIDTAFKRRLTFRVRFEKPNAEARAMLWRKVFPQSCALGPDVDVKTLGELFDMSGGNIRNAAVRAAFLAASAGKPLAMEHCIEAAERESREMGLLTRGRVADDGGAGLSESNRPPLRRDAVTPAELERLREQGVPVMLLGKPKKGDGGTSAS